MALDTLKFKEADFTGADVASLPDDPSAEGYTAAQLKARFDNVGKALLALGRFNELLDAISSKIAGSSGAEQVGAAAVTGLEGTTVQTLLESLKDYIDTQVLEAGAVTSVCGKAGSVTLWSGDITPETLTLTLPVSGWTASDGAYVQTASAPGVSVQNTVIAACAPACFDAWGKSGVSCTEQAVGSLTFSAKKMPTMDLTANVLIVG